MVRNCIVRGSIAVWKKPGLVLCLWIANLLPGVLAVAPLLRWWSDAFDRAPEADRALQGFSLGLVRELVQYDRSPVLGIALSASLMAALLSVLANPFLNGGVVEVLLSRDERPLLSRFFAGAGRYFLRYLGLLAISLFTGGIAVSICMATIRLALRPLTNSGWEPGGVLSGLCVFAAALVVVSFFYMVLDFARIDVAIRDARGVLRGWIQGLRFVWGHRAQCVGILAALTLSLAAMFAAFAVYSRAVPSSSWVLIGLTFLVQQMFVYVRIGLRTSLLAAELELYRAKRD